MRRAAGFILGLLIVTLAPAQTTRQADRLISWQLVADPSLPAIDRHVNRAGFAEGWKTYRAYLQPSIKWGVRRIFLRNPFGTPPDDAGRIDFTQYQQAQESTRWLTSNFVQQVKVLTSNGIEVVAYIGSPDYDLRVKAAKNNPRALWEIINANLDPLVKSGCSVAFDASSMLDSSSLTYTVAEHLRRLGVKVYVEARPSFGTSWYSYPIICHSEFWDRSDPEKYPDAAPRYVRNGQLSGEIILLIPSNADYSWAGRGWEKPWAVDVLRRGYTAGLWMDRVLELERFDPAIALKRDDLLSVGLGLPVTDQ